MERIKKQSVLLGLREKLEKSFGGMLDDFISKFKGKQGIFSGWNRTFVAEDGFADQSEKRSFQKVGSTVKEQLDWFKKHTLDYFNTVLSVEKTNSTGIKAELFVAGESWGEYTSLELLRLKSIIDGKFDVIIKELPIRSEKLHWVPTTNKDLYEGKEVFETPMTQGYTKTTLKRTEIVNDPHIKDSAFARPPVPVQFDTQVNTGLATEQLYSGEITNLERAQYMVRLDQIRNGVVEALETANNVDSVESDLGKKFLDFMFK